MNLADLLTYADIDHLKRMADHYGCEQNMHSKNGLISSLLHHMGRSSRFKGEMDVLDPKEFRFLQQLCLDSRHVFSWEELMGKGRAALGDDQGHPRRLVTVGFKKGWLFPGISHRDKSLYQVPLDLRQRFLKALSDRYVGSGSLLEPVVCRNEEGILEEDLLQFLLFLSQNEVHLTSEGGIYRQQQRQILKKLHVLEEPVDRKGWRFGFGRRYHQYPDRFSLLYDYAYYKGYLWEDEVFSQLRLTETGAKVLQEGQIQEIREIYRFWLRLYKKPIPHLTVVCKWVNLLAQGRWEKDDRIEEAVQGWLQPYYYETESDVFLRITKMMLHLGLIQIGKDSEGCRLLQMNRTGHLLVSGEDTFSQKDLESRYLEAEWGKNN